MIITESTLVGYTILCGGWRLQLALLLGTVYNTIAAANVQNSAYLQLSDEQKSRFKDFRWYYLPICHFFLVIFCAIQDIPNKSVRHSKQVFAFVGCLTMILVMLLVSNLLSMFPTHFVSDVR